MRIITIPARPPARSPVAARVTGEQGGARAGRARRPGHYIAVRRKTPAHAAIVVRSEDRRLLASIPSSTPPAGGRISSLIARPEAVRARRAAAIKFTKSPLK